MINNLMWFHFPIPTSSS